MSDIYVTLVYVVRSYASLFLLFPSHIPARCIAWSEHPPPLQPTHPLFPYSDWAVAAY